MQARMNFSPLLGAVAPLLLATSLACSSDDGTDDGQQERIDECARLRRPGMTLGFRGGRRHLSLE
jgi:hypothetical protein